MKIKVTNARGWRGPLRFLLRASDGPKDAATKSVTVPDAVGTMVTLDRNGRTGEGQIVVSLGKRAKIDAETLRRAGGAITAWMINAKVNKAGVAAAVTERISETECVQALAEGLHLRDYDFNRYRKGASRRPQLTVDILVPKGGKQTDAMLRRVKAICTGVITARDLAHEPPNVINPLTLAARVKTLAKTSGLTCRVFDDKQLERMKAGAIVAVGKGSATPARLIVLEYKPRNATNKKPVVLIGKAITFDTGGYSLKTKDSICGMKYDKCGGMTVIGAMQAVAALKPKTPVVGIIAAAENMIAGNAYRPDDIITTMSGKTVQIVSADAEGRMVLCDALTYAQRNYKPRCMIDLATLTGGVVITLGGAAAAVMGNDDSLQEKLRTSGLRVHERLWPLPLWDEYADLIKGDDSDIKNSGGREAHAIVGGIFLKQFVDSKVPWAHLDIAGMGDITKDGPYCPKGATGFGVRLLLDYIQNL